MVDLSIAIVTYNNEKIILRCIESIISHINDLTYQIYVIDNNSSDNTVDTLKFHDKIILIQNKRMSVLALLTIKSSAYSIHGITWL